MDGIESIGMRAVVAPIEPMGRIPDAATISSRRASQAPDPIRDGDQVSVDADRLEERKKQIARDFESVLLTKLFDQVQESIGGWGLEEEDTASQQVQGLFWLQLAQDVADKGGLGLWKDIYQYLQQMDGTDTGEIIDEGL